MILKEMMVELAMGVLDIEVDEVVPLMAKFETNASGTTEWAYFQLMQESQTYAWN